MRIPKKRTICEICGLDVSVNKLKCHQKGKRCKPKSKDGAFTSEYYGGKYKKAKVRSQL